MKGRAGELRSYGSRHSKPLKNGAIGVISPKVSDFPGNRA